MKRTYITFSHGENNDALSSILKESLAEFSQYDLRVYRKEDFEEDYGMDSDPGFWSSGKGYVYKVLSCMKALEEYDEIVWIDTDCVATSYIDKIWFESWRIDGYPLLPKSRFYLFGRDLSTNSDIVDVGNPFFLRKGKEKMGVRDTSKRSFYSQACFMLFDHSCKWFFKEALGLFREFDSECFPNGDETIINCLFWRYGFADTLGDIFICSHFFGYGSKEIAGISERERLMDFRYRPSYNAFENIMFYHGTKSTEIARSILSALLNARKNKIRLRKEPTRLCEIMERKGSDKSTWHNYTRLYDTLFSDMVGKGISIFELGLGTNNTSFQSNMGEDGRPGASIRAWKEYFINAQVRGADIDRDILFEEDSIKTFYCDQTDHDSIAAMWADPELSGMQFDIIIDDGLHEFRANMIFLANSINKLKPGGIYVVEDIYNGYLGNFRESIAELKSAFPGFEFQIIEIPYENNQTDNNILLAKKL